jgi:hypothetical protein
VEKQCFAALRWPGSTRVVVFGQCFERVHASFRDKETAFAPDVGADNSRPALRI